jgi:GNAT superfamily N-acetyltransferase
MTVSVHNAAHVDLNGIVVAHCSAFPCFFMTLLGRRFLTVFYRHFIDHPLGIALIARDAEGPILGFLAGTREPAEFFRVLRKRQGLTLALAAVPALVCHPIRVAERLWAAVRYRGDAPPELPGYWLLSSFGVRKDRAGAGIGTALLLQFLAGAVQAGAAGIYLVTDSHENERTRSFYLRHGFAMHSQSVRPDGRRMELLVRDLK